MKIESYLIIKAILDFKNGLCGWFGGNYYVG